MQNNSVNKGIFYFLGTRIWASMQVYQHKNPSRFVTDSIQINIKFTFTIYEYILLSNYIYIIYIYIYIYNIYNIYIYFVFFCLFKHCRNTCTHWSHRFPHIHIIFSSWFYLIIVTSRNSLPNCEHDSSYQ